MILQSKMNFQGFDKSFRLAKNYLDQLDLDKWIAIDEIPASIIAEVIILVDEGFNVNKNIELDETFQFIKVTKKKIEIKIPYLNRYILNVETGVFYYTIEEALASISNRFSPAHLSKMLNGYHPNRTNLIIV